jgi:hypothetical protein
MDIHDYKKRLEKVEQKIRNSNISERNKKIISDYERQMFIKEFSTARIERCLSIVGMVSEKLKKDIDSLEKDDIEVFLEWVQRKDITDWTRYTYKQVFKTFLNRLSQIQLQ